MAHFAELDDNNVVQRVVVVGNDVATAAGPLGANDMHVDGETWCVNFFKTGNWKQTSYNNSFRKQYCGTGFTYDPAKDKFLSPQPFNSWTLDANDDWESPVTFPTITKYGDPEKNYDISWDEEGQKWTAKDAEDPINNFNWDASTLAWVSA
jgi:hypothetical protein